MYLTPRLAHLIGQFCLVGIIRYGNGLIFLAVYLSLAIDRMKSSLHQLINLCMKSTCSRQTKLRLNRGLMSLSGNQIAGQDPTQARQSRRRQYTYTYTYTHTYIQALCARSSFKEVQTAAIVGCLRFAAWRIKRRWRQRRHLNAMESYANSHVH